MGVELELDRTVTDVEAAMREGGFDAAFLAVGAHIGKRAYIPAGVGREGARRRLRCCAAWRARSSRCSAAASSSTAAATPRWTSPAPPGGSGAEEAVVVYRRTRDRMPAHDFEVEEALEEGVLVKWLSTIKHADDGKLVLEQMELDESGFPQPTGELEELEADSLVLALGQETDLSLLDGVAGHRGRRRRRAGRDRT